MDGSVNELIIFRCGDVQRQYWEYYVTASWEPYHKHNVIRSAKVLHRTNDVTRSPAVTELENETKTNGTLLV